MAMSVAKVLNCGTGFAIITIERIHGDVKQGRTWVVEANTDREGYVKHFPFAEFLRPEEKTLLADAGCIRIFEKGSLIDSTYRSRYGFLYVISGGIRVCVVSEEGREVTLYRVTCGECGVFAAQKILDSANLNLNVIASERTELLLIGAVTFSGLAERNPYVKNYSYETITKRLASSLWVMQQIVFTGFDRRLATFLLEECERTGSRELWLTQEELAQNVNSAREVVARMLRRFADSGIVEVRRGSVYLKSPERLREICD